MKRILMVVAACSAAAVCGLVTAQWTVTVLTPDAARLSRAYGIFGRQQVGDGFLKDSTSPHAFLWEGTPESWVDLQPPGASTSAAYGTDGIHQVGFVLRNSVWHASMWSGTADSWVSLNPMGAQFGVVYSIAGGVQTGGVDIDGTYRASLWRGTPESWVDLNPPSTWNGVAFGTDGLSQVGQVTLGGVPHASLWRGSAETFVDLDPSVNVGGSAALAVWGDQQVGWVSMDNEGGTHHASLWNGTAKSWVDLHPGSDLGTPYHSEALGAYQGYQVGYSTTHSANCIMNGMKKAVLWRGSAETCESLHKYLPFDASNSMAYGVWCDDTTIYVIGEADGREIHAVLWTRPIDSPPPSCLADIDGNGFVNALDYDQFAEAFESGDPDADFNSDCFVNGIDYDQFAEAFEAGC